MRPFFVKTVVLLLVLVFFIFALFDVDSASVTAKGMASISFVKGFTFLRYWSPPDRVAPSLLSSSPTPPLVCAPACLEFKKKMKTKT